MAEENTRLQNAFEAAGDSAGYDSAAAKILSEPRVLGTLVMFCVPELRGYTLDQVIGFLVDIDVQRVSLFPDGEVPPVDRTVFTDKTIDEGNVAFDILVHVRLPENSQTLRVLFGVEAQGKDGPRKRLDNRMQYTACRMVCMQHDKEFVSPNYEKIVPIYSVWVVLNPPEMWQNTFEVYENRNVVNEEKWQYDLLRKKTEDTDEAQQKPVQRIPMESLTHILVYRTGDPDKATRNVERFLDIIFSRELKPAEKGNLLEKEYGIPQSRKLEDDFVMMGVFSSALIAQTTEEVTKKVTDEVTKKVTDEVTKKVTDEVTKKVTDDVTKKVTDDVTKKVTDEVTKKVTDEVTRQNAIRTVRAMRDTWSVSRKAAKEYLLEVLGLSEADAAEVIEEAYSQDT